MDASHKNRVVGAIVLILLGLAVLPWMFGNPQDPTATIRSSFDGQPVRVTAPPVVRSVRMEDVAQAPEPSPLPVVTSSPAPAAPRPPAVPVVSAAPQARPQASPAPVAQSGWILQLASFSKRANAHGFEQRLQADGYPVYLEQVNIGGRELFRVRLAGGDSESQARKLKAKLENAYGGPISLYPPN